tara:strand:- start:1201 stop:2052 length:852 start_codon:yes stop_codon:yes gene_type:complete
MRFGCTGNFNKASFYTIIEKLDVFFKKNNFELMLDKKIPYDSSSLTKYDLSTIANESDLLITIGGDGTILSTIRELGDKKIPIFGIHIGGLGFLTQTNSENCLDSLNKILQNKFSTVDRMLLKTVVDGKNKQSFYALNDIVIDHGNSPRILETNISISNTHLNKYKSDGIIICTPLGSTAYSLSAGGPIITPWLDVISLTPICPHSLSARPILLPSDDTVLIQFNEEQIGMKITIDGQISFEIDYTTKITVSKSKNMARFIKLDDSDYFLTLRSKMGWSGNVR